MSEPTGGELPAQAPQLLDYSTWVDEEGYHARFLRHLPEPALDYGCVQEIWATTEQSLLQEAVHNRVKVWAWESQAHEEPSDRHRRPPAEPSGMRRITPRAGTPKPDLRAGDLP